VARLTYAQSKLPLPPIKALCAQRHISIRQFAEDAGMRYEYVWRVFTGQKPPWPELVQFASRYFNLPAELLFGPEWEQTR
jgi:transcriptional regulator with XRE-family HTH domain